jgi:hypothetical protein
MARKRKRSSIRFGGWWYLLINFPLVIFVKSGITSGKVAARAKQVDKAAPGIPIPIFAVWLPGDLARRFEQGSHKFFSGIRVTYYEGDGYSEWFFIVAAPFILIEMTTIWMLYFCLASKLFFGEWFLVCKLFLKIFCKIFAHYF